MKKLFLLLFFTNLLFSGVKSLTLGEELISSVGEQKIRYFKLKVLKNQTVNVSIDKLKEDADIYLKVNSKPTLLSYGCKSSHANRKRESCTLSVTKDSNLYIGIYGFKETSYRLKTALYSYGEKGKDKVRITFFMEDNSSVIIHPKDWKDNATPIVFFAPGFDSQSYKEYLTLLTYIASQGYSVIYVKDNADIKENNIDKRFAKFKEIVNKFSHNLDSRKIGMLGYSLGGGISFPLLKKMINLGWGERGRFMFLIEPWFAFSMNKSDIKSIVDTNVVLLQFGEKGSSSDPRISLVEYRLLRGIEKNKKDYQVYKEENATHSYPIGNRPIAEMQGVLKPLDALMKYSFEKEKSAEKFALNMGSEHPYIEKKIKFKPIENYNEGGCKGEHLNQKKMIRKYTIDYCSVPKL